jgi:hypothetical protein
MSVSRSQKHRTGAIVAISLLIFPLFAVPLYLMGFDIARGVDDDRTNGVLQLGLLLGPGLPALASVLLTRLKGGLRWPAALAVGVSSGVLSVVVLFLAFMVYLHSCGPNCT